MTPIPDTPETPNCAKCQDLGYLVMEGGYASPCQCRDTRNVAETQETRQEPMCSCGHSKERHLDEPTAFGACLEEGCDDCDGYSPSSSPRESRPLGIVIDPDAPSLSLTLYPEAREPHAALIAEMEKDALWLEEVATLSDGKARPIGPSEVDRMRELAGRIREALSHLRQREGEKP